MFFNRLHEKKDRPTKLNPARFPRWQLKLIKTLRTCSWTGFSVLCWVPPIKLAMYGQWFLQLQAFNVQVIGSDVRWGRNMFEFWCDSFRNFRLFVQDQRESFFTDQNNRLSVVAFRIRGNLCAKSFFSALLTEVDLWHSPRFLLMILRYRLKQVLISNNAHFSSIIKVCQASQNTN